uniref:bifunctional aminoglycoside phosphotransferase/ATP-binding protein n=1 Tax=Castellaniella defragrans TaxID=75697 RepID=UPI0033429A45
MIVEDQIDVLRFLEDPASYGGDAATVSMTTTHISVIFFVGQRVFKLKRAVRLPYVDFSTVAQRLAACQQELTLNRRTAPTLYLGVRRITREADGRLAFDGQGELVDAVVEMRRFDESTLFNTLAAEGRLTPVLLTGLARMIARFHADAAISLQGGGEAGIASVLDGNERSLASTDVFDAGTVAALTAQMRAALHRHAPLLEARRRAGKVRRCHGDLHLRNICLVDGAPTLFDCLEFDEDIATIDVLYDLAFLVMDLWHHGLEAEANLVFNRYLDECDETDGLSLMPFFMAIRATVRAHVTATQAAQAADSQRAALVSQARAYAALALRLLAPVPVRMVAVGGLSGTGKSTVAAAIAHRIGPAPGARVLASDRIRKRLHGVLAEVRLPPQAYDPKVSERVYAVLVQEAQAVLEAGHAVVADAVFNRPASRERIERVARAAHAPFTGIWFHAQPETLYTRVDARRGDPSDATVEVLRVQLENQKDRADWIWIATDEGIAATVSKVIEVI